MASRKKACLYVANTDHSQRRYGEKRSRPKKNKPDPGDATEYPLQDKSPADRLKPSYSWDTQETHGRETTRGSPPTEALYGTPFMGLPPRDPLKWNPYMEHIKGDPQQRTPFRRPAPGNHRQRTTSRTSLSGNTLQGTTSRGPIQGTPAMGSSSGTSNKGTLSRGPTGTP